MFIEVSCFPFVFFDCMKSVLLDPNYNAANLSTRHLRVFMWCAKASQESRLWHLRLKMVWTKIFASYPAWVSLETDILELMMMTSKWLPESKSTISGYFVQPTRYPYSSSAVWKSAKLAFDLYSAGFYFSWNFFDFGRFLVFIILYINISSHSGGFLFCLSSFSPMPYG